MGLALTRRSLLVVVMVLLVVPSTACTKTPSTADVRPELSALLPEPGDLGPALSEGVEARSWSSSAGPSSSPSPILSRPGEAGYSQYQLVGGDEPSYVEVVVYRLASGDEARRFWQDRPPVEAHAETAVNPSATPGDPTEADLRRWSLEPPSQDDERFEWQAICLSSGLQTSARDWCSDISGWVRFCRYAMEVRLFGDRYTDTTQWHALYELLADDTATTAGCD